MILRGFVVLGLDGAAVHPAHSDLEPFTLKWKRFDGTKSVHSVRRKAKRDVVHRASFATTPMD